jgi:hypothetical protein
MAAPPFEHRLAAERARGRIGWARLDGWRDWLGLDARYNRNEYERGEAHNSYPKMHQRTFIERRPRPARRSAAVMLSALPAKMALSNY